MTDPTSQALFEERYGRARTRSIDKKLGWIVAGVAVATGLAVILFGGWQQNADIDSQVLHYTVIDERTVEIDAQVTSPPDATVVCALEALSASHGTVGWKLVTVPKSESTTHRFTSQLVTTAPATSGLVRECWTHPSA